MKKFPKILRDLRLQYGYTQKEIAEKIGITYQSYQAYEHGISYPTVEKLVIIADLFDVSTDYLLGRKDI